MDLYPLLRLSVYLIALSGAVAIWDVENDLTCLLAVLAAAAIARLTVDAGRLKPVRAGFATVLSAALLAHFAYDAFWSRGPYGAHLGLLRMLHFLCAVQVVLFFAAFRGSLIFTFCGANLFIVIVSGILSPGLSLLLRLAVFLCCATWLLFVHALWIEKHKFESRQPSHASSRRTRAGRAGRLSERGFWQGLQLSGLVACACLACGFVLFFAWPRVTLRLLQVFPGRTQPEGDEDGFLTPVRDGGAGIQVTGPGETVDLNQLSPLFVDSSPACRVTFDRPLSAFANSEGAIYLRGRSLATYARNRWQMPPRRHSLRAPPGESFVAFDAQDPNFLAPPGGLVFVRQELRLLSGATTRAALCLAPIRRAQLTAVEVDEEGGFELPRNQRFAPHADYEFSSNKPVYPEDLPQSARAVALHRRYLDWRQVFGRPQDLRMLEQLRDDLLQDARGDKHKALRLCIYLRDSGHCRYQLDPGNRTPGEDRLALFLLSPDPQDRQGNCGYFATAFVILCRSAGLPARLATGFAHSVRPEEAGRQQLTFLNSDAHAWGEVYFEKYGWVAFDPTASSGRGNSGTDQTSGLSPNFPRPRGESSRPPPVFRSSEPGWLNQSWSYFLDFDSRQQDRIYGAVGGAFQRFVQQTESLLSGSGNWGPAGAVVIWIILAAFATWVVFMLWRRSERRRAGAIAFAPRMRAAVAFYQELLQVLQRRGYVRPRGQTPREFAAAVVRRGGEPLRPILALTDAFERVRYGGEELPDAEQEQLRRALGGLREALARPLGVQAGRAETGAQA
jgi:transglutaminase-like putative cysteine protease